MFVLGLITCVALTAFSAHAKVLDSFEECRGFFYQGIEPSGMDQNAKKICQKWENGRFYYATLYSVYHKIPLYSAYILDPKCSTDKKRTDIWHLEPQISQRQSQTDYMVQENSNTQNLHRGNQAISSDYSYTGYDRGHLNPSSFQCSDGRKATFTLTNAAPMKERFNRVHWRRWETTLRGYLIQQLIKEGYLATAFIVTGTVPDPNVRIPHTNRVTVPSHIWTAVCYKHSDNSKSFSFGFIGRNQENPGIKLMSVSELNNELKLRFRTNQQIKIFADDCFGMLPDIRGVFQKLINLPVNQAVQTNSGIEDMYRNVKNTFSYDVDDGDHEKRVKVDENTGKMSFSTMSTFYNVAENLKAFTTSACLITKAKGAVWNWHVETIKWSLVRYPDDLECQLVEEKTAADGSLCSSVSESDYSCQCTAGGETKPCCTSPCVYLDNFNGYMCYSEQKLIKCSPPYSFITVNGEKCSWDHHCATYGYDYYWCKTAAGSWDYCSPPLWNSKTKNRKDCLSDRACAKYGYNYEWCYTDDEGNWDYC